MSILDGPVRANPGAYAWFVVALLWVVALLNYLDRLMIASMRDPIRHDISMSDAQFGLLTSVFLWTYAACSPFGGFAADRFGKRGVIVASLLFWSAATWFTGAAHTFQQLLLARSLMGISEACYLPAALALIADYHRGPTRSLGNGIHMTGLYAGITLGGIGGYLAEWYGWRTGFRLFGCVGIAYSVFLALSLRDAAPADLPETASPQCDQPRLSDVLTRILQSNGFRALLVMNILVSAANWSIYGWLPTYLKDHFHLGLGKAGLTATAYVQGASFVGVLAGGTLADRWIRSNRRGRVLVPAIGYLVAAPCLLVAASTSNLGLAIAGFCVFGLGRGTLDANQMPILRELVDERYSATGYGILNLVGTLTGGAMIYIGGAMLDAHIELNRIFQGCAAGLLMVGLLLWSIRVPTKAPEIQAPLAGVDG